MTLPFEVLRIIASTLPTFKIEIEGTMQPLVAFAQADLQKAKIKCDVDESGLLAIWRNLTTGSFEVVHTPTGLKLNTRDLRLHEAIDFANWFAARLGILREFRLEKRNGVNVKVGIEKIREARNEWESRQKRNYFFFTA